MAAVGKNPTRVGEPLTVAGDLRVAASGLDKAVLQRVMNQLGIAGTVESFGPTYVNSGEPNNLAVVVRDAAGQTSQIGLSLDAEGVIRTASRVDLHVDAAKLRAGRAYLDEVAKLLNRDRGALRAAYDAQVRTSGKAPIEAVAAVLAAERKSLPMGTELPPLDSIEELRTYGLTTQGESAPSWRRWPGSTRAAALEAEGRGRLDRRDSSVNHGLRQAYVEALAASGSRDGAGAALQAVMAKMPKPLEKFPVQLVVTGKLVTPAALPATLRAWKEGTNATNAAVAGLGHRLVRLWCPHTVVTALDELVARNSSGKEVLDKLLELLRHPTGPCRGLTRRLLEELGVLSPPEAWRSLKRSSDSSMSLPELGSAGQSSNSHLGTMARWVAQLTLGQVQRRPCAQREAQILDMVAAVHSSAGPATCAASSTARASSRRRAGRQYSRPESAADPLTPHWRTPSARWRTTSTTSFGWVTPATVPSSPPWPSRNTRAGAPPNCSSRSSPPTRWRVGWGPRVSWAR